MKTISKKTRYISTGGWRGYVEPINAIAGANDTGTYSDSPCPSDVCDAELGKVKRLFRKNGIRYNSMTTPSSNIFCVHRYLIVAPEDRERAIPLVKEAIEDTRLLYVCDHKV